ncbi:hypothetical protein A2Z00_03020 [Candidatus Gottesmanbacteria bacterium RBG_13_45_10]|uniref:Uncharacterized protein n=1 Tax=Candidatus Gottesmanbacteria bacterium RBG_13_45_10 TaxID=1798370 RepID=A0A1F5ZIH9_9BACT|nr:MAG: hypothetical protein A2Z00_03020 [Candidatus Gottesmanbacteria bacterium RBG_13_45_10]
MSHYKEIQQTPPYDIPESLQFWTSNDSRGKSLSWDQVARQVYDLTTLPEENWAFFQELAGRFSPLDQFVREAEAFKELDSKEQVRKYFEAELLKNQDPYFMMGKIGMPGSGIRGFYDRLLRIAGLDDLTDEERVKVQEMLGYWEEAAIDVVCDDEAFFTKTETGNEGTISEFLGTSIDYDVHISGSPNMANGRYRDRFLSAIDYDGIVNGKYNRDDFDQFNRQDILLQLLHASQGSNRLGYEFWQAIGANEDFLMIVHDIAVKEGFTNVDDLLVRTMNYAWRKSQEGSLHYDWVSHQILDDHFEGKTAADKFLTDPEMRFEERFAGSRSNVQNDYLWDYQRVSENSQEMVVLLDCAENGDSFAVRYAKVGDSYSEQTVNLDLAADTIEGVNQDVAITLVRMVKEFETFKRNYLQRLSS